MSHPAKNGKVMKYQTRASLPLFAIAALLSIGCGDDDDAPGVQPGPDLIVFDRPNLQPEGIEYDAQRGRFIVGSRTGNTILAVADDGAISTFAAPDQIRFTLGIEVDEIRDQLIAATSLEDGTPSITYFDLTSGEIERTADLGLVATGPNLINDVTVDSAGNAFATDTLGAAVYRVAPNGDVDVLAQGDDLGEANGIEIIDDEILLVARLFGPSLVRIPINDPEQRSEVASENPVTGDGIVALSSNQLAIVSVMPPNRVFLYTTEDGWASTQRVGAWDASSISDSSPTTAAVRGGDVHVIFAHLFDEANTTYEIAKVEF